MLKDILYKVNSRSVKGNTNIEIKDLQIDSRKVTAGSCFIAINGSTTNGHNYIEKAIENGAVAIIHEKFSAIPHDGITYIEVENSAIAAGIISSNFYNSPSTQLLVGGRNRNKWQNNDRYFIVETV